MSSDNDKPDSGLRVGGALPAACTMALVGALVGALPTAYRTASAGGNALDGFVMAAAVLLTLLLPLAWLQPKAARGYRGVVGPQAPRGLGVGLGIWASLGVVGLFALATFLKAKTNHRGLGGATLGVFGAAWLVVAAVVAARLVRFGRKLIDHGMPPQLVRGMAALLMAVPVGVIGAALVLGGAGGLLSAALFDLALMWLLVIAAMWRPLPEALARAGRYVALPLAVVVLLIGWLRVELSGSTPAVKQGGGIVSSALIALEMWSDRDGDGQGAHFGGGDCDEGDPTRYAGATETPGDGVDSDCDGSDPPGALANVHVAPQPQPATAQAPKSQPGADTTAAHPAGSTSPSATAATTASNAPAPSPASSPALAGSPDRLVKQPDIVLVTLDTVRADRTSLYGYEKNTTPGLKQLAERAVVFEHAYAIGSTTQRALMPLVSGLPLSETPRSRREWPRLKEEADTIAERLKRAGYATGAITSFTWLRKDRGFAQGFDHFDESPWRDRHPERKTTGEGAASAAIEMHQRLAKGDKPIFLWLHLFDAHSLYIAHSEFDFGRGDSGNYDSEIGFVDQQLSRLVTAIDKSARKDRTVWLVHGSHGEAFGEHDQTGHGGHVYEEMLRVPLLIGIPGAPAGRYTRDAVSTLDIPKTLLDLADTASDSLPGLSLRAAAQGDFNFERPPVRAYARRRVALYDWPLKLSVTQRGRGRTRLLLFDLSADPKEKRDLSGDRPDDLKRLETLYRQKE